ncbi:hypothetical protein [Acinetobacter modestus]|uniref:hypothetical protein n=1 Tax=Acinetobacter modestus TaxID=1776740 RepID=UPI0030160958
MTLDSINEIINNELNKDLTDKELAVKNFIKEWGWKFASVHLFARSNMPNNQSEYDLNILQRFIYARTCIDKFNDIDGIKKQACMEFCNSEGSLAEYHKLIQACVDLGQFTK